MCDGSLVPVVPVPYSTYYSFNTNIIIYCNVLNTNKTYN